MIMWIGVSFIFLWIGKDLELDGGNGFMVSLLLLRCNKDLRQGDPYSPFCPRLWLMFWVEWSIGLRREARLRFQFLIFNL